VVQMNPVYTSSTVPTGSAPQISSFTATPASLTAGETVTLNWSVIGAAYLIVSPGIGAVRGTSATFNPSQTGIYTLYATGPYGRSQATVNITVN
jgi:hypothetical protein